MGYFTSAFLLKTEPDWNRLADVAPSLAMLAVRHEESGLCLLSVRGKEEDEPDYPFSAHWSEQVAAAAAATTTISADSARLIERFVAAAEVASDDYQARTIVAPALRIGLQLERALGCPLFFFAANDDGLNFAYELSSGAFSSLRIDGECGSAEVGGGKVSLKPLIVTFDDDVDEIDFSPLEPFDDILVHPTQVIPEDEHEGNELFSVPLALWPEGWPDPAESLGIGTWDPLVGYPKGYATCFARR